MTTDTPRTDAEQIELLEVRTPKPYRVVERWVVGAAFARELECDLAECRLALRELIDAATEMARVSYRTWDGEKWLWNDHVWERADPDGFLRVAKAYAILAKGGGE